MPTKIIATIEDASGDQSTTEIKVPSATTIANLTTFAVSWLTAMNLIIYGKILSAVAYILPGVGTLTGNTLFSTAMVERQGHFIFLSVAGSRVEVNVPALAEAIVAATTADELDQSDTQTAAFIAAMTTGIAVTGSTIAPCDIAESSISDVLIANETHKNTGKAA